MGNEVSGQNKAEGEAGFECYKYGFMSRSGFAVKPEEKLILIPLDEMYDEFSFKAQGFDVK